MMNGFILQENTSILISRNGKTLYSILHRSLDLTEKFAQKKIIKIRVDAIFGINYTSFVSGIPVLLTVILGPTLVGSAINYIPEWVTGGLKVAGDYYLLLG